MIFRTKQDQDRQEEVVRIHNFLYNLTHISYPDLQRIVEITKQAGLSIQLLTEYINQHTFKPLEADLVALTYQYILVECYEEVKAKTDLNIFKIKSKNHIYKSGFATEYNFKGYKRLQLQSILNSVDEPSNLLKWFQEETQK